jgi:plastocyanin
MPLVAEQESEDLVTHDPRRAVAVLGLFVPLLLAGCGGTASSGTASSGTASSGTVGGTGSGSSSASPSSSGSAGGTGCAVARTITVEGSNVTPSPATLDVKAGCPVELTVTADHASEVHVHVVDLEEPVAAGTPETIRFTPKQQGVYEVELHDPDLLLVKLAVR